MDRNKELIKETEEYREKIIEMLNEMDIVRLKFYYKFIYGIEKERENRS